MLNEILINDLLKNFDTIKTIYKEKNIVVKNNLDILQNIMYANLADIEVLNKINSSLLKEIERINKL